MRHRNKTKKLGRTKSHRRATLGNMARSIIEHQQVKTTLAKAKAARSVIERLITFGKKDTVAARRQAFKLLQNHLLVKKLFDEVAPTFADRKGGYTRVIKLGQRRGDGAELAVLQLVGFEPMVIDETKTTGKKKKKEKPAKAKKEKKAAEVKEAEVKTEEAVVEDKEVKTEPEEAEVKVEPEKEEKKTKKTAAKKETSKKETKSKEKAEKPAKEKKLKTKSKKAEKSKEEKSAKEKETPDSSEGDDKDK
ncbi:MAG: 50S ribosomal protein L17 [Calditrichota bacterium]|jgi:large subunit ribosomal protein L17